MRLAWEDNVRCVLIFSISSRVACHCSFVQEQPPLSLPHPSSKGTPTSLLSFAVDRSLSRAITHFFCCKAISGLLLLLGLRLTVGWLVPVPACSLFAAASQRSCICCFLQLVPDFAFFLELLSDFGFLWMSPVLTQMTRRKQPAMTLTWRWMIP